MKQMPEEVRNAIGALRTLSNISDEAFLQK